MLDLRPVNYIGAVGSVDGILTAAAVLRHADPGCKLSFMQPFTVNRVDPTTWTAASTVLLVDLAVNRNQPGMTINFLRRILGAGHSIFGVLDEHDGEAWKAVIGRVKGLSFDRLTIKPVSGKGRDFNSSGALLRTLLSDRDAHTLELCDAAEAADHLNFSTRLGEVVNHAIKTRIHDDSCRVYLAEHFARHTEPDEVIRAWAHGYADILVAHQAVISKKQDIGDGIVAVRSASRIIDVSALLAQLYEAGHKVVVLDGARELLIGCSESTPLDILALLTSAGIKARRFAKRATLPHEQRQTAIALIRKALASIDQ